VKLFSASGFQNATVAMYRLAINGNVCLLWRWGTIRIIYCSYCAPSSAVKHLPDRSHFRDTPEGIIEF